MNWGAVSDFGHVADNPQTFTAVADQFGIKPVPAKQMLNTLNGLLDSTGNSQVVVASGTWQSTERVKPEESSAGLMGDSTHRLNESSSANSKNTRDSVLECVSRVLGLPKNTIDADESIVDLGIDSLLAVELSHLLRADCAFEVSAASLLEQMSVNDILETKSERIQNTD